MATCGAIRWRAVRGARAGRRGLQTPLRGLLLKLLRNFAPLRINRGVDSIHPRRREGFLTLDRAGGLCYTTFNHIERFYYYGYIYLYHRTNGEIR
jgi:hypothetical protein